MRNSYQLLASGASSRRRPPSHEPSRFRSWSFPSSVDVVGQRKNKGRVVSLSVLLLSGMKLGCCGCPSFLLFVCIPDGPSCFSFRLPRKDTAESLPGLPTSSGQPHGPCHVGFREPLRVGGLFCLIVFGSGSWSLKLMRGARASDKGKEQASVFPCSNLVVSFAASALSFRRLAFYYSDVV